MSGSMFGANFGNAALNAAYDMMILDEIEKEGKEIALCGIYGKEEDYVYDER